LHIAPSKGPPFKGEFYQTQMANDIIKNESILQVAPRFISVYERSVEVEITKKDPIGIIIDLVIF